MDPQKRGAALPRVMERLKHLVLVGDVVFEFNTTDAAGAADDEPLLIDSLRSRTVRVVNQGLAELRLVLVSMQHEVESQLFQGAFHIARIADGGCVLPHLGIAAVREEFGKRVKVMMDHRQTQGCRRQLEGAQSISHQAHLPFADESVVVLFRFVHAGIEADDTETQARIMINRGNFVRFGPWCGQPKSEVMAGYFLLHRSMS